MINESYTFFCKQVFTMSDDDELEDVSDDESFDGNFHSISTATFTDKQISDAMGTDSTDNDLEQLSTWTSEEEHTLVDFLVGKNSFQLEVEDEILDDVCELLAYFTSKDIFYIFKRRHAGVSELNVIINYIKNILGESIKEKIKELVNRDKNMDRTSGISTPPSDDLVATLSTEEIQLLSNFCEANPLIRSNIKKHMKTKENLMLLLMQQLPTYSSQN